jgi:hypothetical protein
MSSARLLLSTLLTTLHDIYTRLEGITSCQATQAHVGGWSIHSSACGKRFSFLSSSVYYIRQHSNRLFPFHHLVFAIMHGTSGVLDLGWATWLWAGRTDRFGVLISLTKVHGHYPYRPLSPRYPLLFHLRVVITRCNGVAQSAHLDVLRIFTSFSTHTLHLDQQVFFLRS